MDKTRTINGIINSIFLFSARKFDGQCSHGRDRRRLPRIRWSSYTSQPQVSSSRAYEFIASACDVTKHVSNVNFSLGSNLDPRVSPDKIVKIFENKWLFSSCLFLLCPIVSFLYAMLPCFFFFVFVFFPLVRFSVKKQRWLLPSLP